MTDTPLRFTCVIPTHGRPHLLGDALRSVLTQTDADQLLGAVVVVIDDGDPNSRALVEQFASDYHDIDVRAVASDRLPRGAAQSRNVGAAAAADPYIAFLDDDDLWLPDHLAQSAAVLRGDPAGAAAVVSSRRTENERGEVTAQPTLDRDLVSVDHAYTAGSVVTGSNLVISRRAFDELGGYDVALPVMNDTDFFVRMLQAGFAPLISPEVSVVMRIHSGDQLTRPNERRARGMRVFYEKHRQSMTPAQRRSFRYRMLGMHRLSAPSPVQRAYYALLQLTNVQPARIARRFGAAR